MTASERFLQNAILKSLMNRSTIVPLTMPKNDENLLMNSDSSLNQPLTMSKRDESLLANSDSSLDEYL